MRIATKVLPFLMVHQAKHIENINLPSCRNCVYYKPNFYNDYSSDLNKCKAFGVKNILTDEIKYDFADLCRRDEKKCGIQGKHFEQEPNVNLKILKHKFVKNAPVTILVLLYVVFIVQIAKPTNVI